MRFLNVLMSFQSALWTVGVSSVVIVVHHDVHIMLRVCTANPQHTWMAWATISWVAVQTRALK